MSQSFEKRRKSEQKGRFAEWLCAAYLIFKGYRLLAVRTKTKAGEVDLIAYKNNIVVAVEVKARASIDMAVDAVTPKAQMRICRATALFVGARRELNEAGRRYDILAVTGLRITHIRDAWRDNA